MRKLTSIGAIALCGISLSAILRIKTQMKQKVLHRAQ